MAPGTALPMFPMSWPYQSEMQYPPPSLAGPVAKTLNGKSIDGTNGTAADLSRTHSQASSQHPMHPDPNGAHFVTDQNQLLMQNVMLAEPSLLQEHLKWYFRNEWFTDCKIHFHPEQPGEIYHPIPVHAIIISRSPHLAAMIVQQSPVDHVLKIDIDEFVQPQAVAAVVAYLYGHALQGPFAAPNIPTEEVIMLALQYAAAGQLLEVPDVMSYGFHYAIVNLSWGTIELVLTYYQWANKTLVTQLRSGPVIKTMREQFTDQILKFLAHNFPKDFVLHPLASELDNAPRLPILEEPRRMTTNPALASIQFGRMPADESLNQAREKELILSNVLLSLDTDMLQSLFQNAALGNKIGWNHVGRFMQEVVDERERRRVKVLKALKSETAASKRQSNVTEYQARDRVAPGSTNEQWEETKWQESVKVDYSQPCSFALVKTKVLRNNA
jgi:hypothetical protein